MENMNNFKLRLAGKMEETPKERTIETIRAEYNRLAWQYGNHVYASKCAMESAEALIPLMKAVNVEGEALARSQQAPTLVPPIVDTPKVEETV